MPNNRFFHLLSLHPKYMFMKKNLLHFHQSANPKATGEGLVHRSHHRRSHHLMGSGGAYHDFIPIDKHPVPIRGSDPLAGMGMSHKFRRPAPLKFKL